MQKVVSFIKDNNGEIMKKNRLPLIIVSILIGCFDVLSLILRKDFNSNFWFGFVFVQVSWLVYILMSLLINESSEEQRGIKPLEFINVGNIIIMVILAIVFYAIPKVNNITLLVVPYVVLYAVFAVCVVLSVYNKNTIKRQSVQKPLIFVKNDMINVLKSVYSSLVNEQFKLQVEQIIIKIESFDIDTEDQKFKSLSEKIVFLHENVRRGQESNILFYIQEINKIINEVI